MKGSNNNGPLVSALLELCESPLPWLWLYVERVDFAGFIYFGLCGDFRLVPRCKYLRSSLRFLTIAPNWLNMKKLQLVLSNGRNKYRVLPLGRNFALVGSAVLGTLALWRIRKHTLSSFKDQSVVITGASRGLGLVLAQQFADEGARLTLLARDPGELAKAEMVLTERGADVLTIPCDVRHQAEVDQAIKQVLARYGRINVLINNAGVIQVGPLEHLRLTEFEEALAVHAWGPLYTMLAVIPHMREQGAGRIVNIASIGGLVAVPHLLPYAMSKFALVGLSDGMRAELAKANIQVTTVCPGLMRTGSHVNALFKGHHTHEFSWFAIVTGLPLASTSVQQAARQIVEACRRGAPQLTITLPARLIAIANGLFPRLVGRSMAVMNRLLPPPNSGQGDVAQTGWESQSRWAPSLLTRLADQAVSETNSLKGHAPLVSGNNGPE